MAVAIKDVDRGLAARVAALRELGRLEVVVGVLAQEGGKPHRAAARDDDDGDVTVLEIAAQHEFGVPAARIPQRSFVRAYVDEHAGEVRAWQRHLAIEVLAGRLRPRQALEQLGARVVAGMQQRIAAGIDPPNAALTVELKGSSTPLVNTGQLRGSITYAVRAKSGR